MLILMCGLPFSGKSTLARAIVEYTVCGYVSLDAINKERGLGFGSDGIPVEEWERSHSVALERLRDRLPEGDVILDDTCCYRWIRDRYRALAAKIGVPTRVIYLDIPAAVISQRMQANRVAGDRRNIRSEIFKQVLDTFETPGGDENVIVFDGSASVHEWLARNLE
jgi:predicted kinase